MLLYLIYNTRRLFLSYICYYFNNKLLYYVYVLILKIIDLIKSRCKPST
jgi:hypothetical protein